MIIYHPFFYKYAKRLYYPIAIEYPKHTYSLKYVYYPTTILYPKYNYYAIKAFTILKLYSIPQTPSI